MTSKSNMSDHFFVGEFMDSLNRTTIRYKFEKCTPGVCITIACSPALIKQKPLSLEERRTSSWIHSELSSLALH